jgi:hypothetical protein
MAAYASNPVVMNTPSGCCTPPVVNVPTEIHPTCATPTGTIVVNSPTAGTLEYSVDNGANWQSSSTFSVLNPGNYSIKVRFQNDPSCMAAYAGNPVVLNTPTGCCTPPVVNVPTVTQPTCDTPIGTIVVNSPTAGTLEYSVNNGTDWQSSPTFTGLTSGSYNLKVRFQNDPSCMAAYASNPIVLSSGLPTYTNACTSGDYIEDFIFGAFSNLGTGCGSPGPGNWSNYLGTGLTVQQGQTYSVMAKAGPGFGQWFGLYADFNQDGDFLDPGEFFDLGQATAGGTATLNVMIPISALAGTSKLRVRSSFNGALLAEDGCNTNLEYGEIEDYDLSINAPCDIPDLTIGSQTPCNPNSNTYTQEVTVPIQWPLPWDFWWFIIRILVLPPVPKLLYLII